MRAPDSPDQHWSESVRIVSHLYATHRFHDCTLTQKGVEGEHNFEGYGSRPATTLSPTGDQAVISASGAAVDGVKQRGR